MFSLPDAAQNYLIALKIKMLNEKGLESYKNEFMDYFLKEKEAAENAEKQNHDFDQKKIFTDYAKAKGISPESFNEIFMQGSFFKTSFEKCSKNLGAYELINIKDSLKNYSSSQKKIKKTVNYFYSNLETLVSKDSSDFKNTMNEIEKLEKESKKALLEHIEKHSKDYDGLSINDFKGENVSDEVA
ncbi:MAG: hypothetical protein PHS81_03230, partial [Candidatus Nanoarchaeia archaeon]|nr:hypothetical protein [Candidatus Nanoarchaeia archaeon]